jgi:hypothetical protein
MRDSREVVIVLIVVGLSEPVETTGKDIKMLYWLSALRAVIMLSISLNATTQLTISSNES